MVDYATTDSAHYPYASVSVNLNGRDFKVEMCFNHIVLEWIVVISFVEQWVYAAGVNLQSSMVNHLAGYRYWQRGCNLLAVFWKKQHVQSPIVNKGFQRPVKKICLEVNHDVVLVGNKIGIVIEI